MLETLGQINIGNLNIEEPKREIIPFDPRIEITDTDWDWIEGDLRRFVSIRDFTKFLSVGSVMRVLNPERAKRLDVIDKLWPVVQDNFGLPQQQILNMQTEAYISYAGRLKMLYPEKFEESSKYKDYLDATSYRIRAYLGANRLLSFDYKNRTLAAFIKIAFPEEVNFTAEPILTQLKKFEDYPHGEDLLYAFAGYLRILAPEDYKMNFKHDIWKGLKPFLIGFRERQDSDVFLDVAFQMALLAATKVKVSENGLELIFPEFKKPFSEEIPALPEMRKF
ncbi:MAG: hypothetical protein Q7R49_01935 [Candidatus Daviesbacteria bacterium]|nr:hypothetical protein [Candidatus Daviesbacteria bacterium]